MISEVHSKLNGIKVIPQDIDENLRFLSQE